jgi:hypothetical protein
VTETCKSSCFAPGRDLSGGDFFAGHGCVGQENPVRNGGRERACSEGRLAEGEKRHAGAHHLLTLAYESSAVSYCW